MKYTCIAAGRNPARLAARMKVFGLTNRQLASVVLLCCSVCLCTQLVQAQPQSFTTLQSGFTQAIFGADSPTTNFGGVAFAPDGDAWVADCVFNGGTLFRFDLQTTNTVNTTPTHPGTSFPSAGNGCGLTNHPNGNLYSNTDSGVVAITNPSNDATAPSLISTRGDPGNALGITVDPQTNNLVYVGADCRFTSTCTIWSIGPSDESSTQFAQLSNTQADFVDGVTFDPTGNFLFLATRSPLPFKLTILDRTGAIVQQVPMSSEPDGIAFHGQAPHFVVTNNNDGTMTRFDFANDNYATSPTISTFANGGFRGDLAQVGPDSCLYVTQDETRYDNGTIDDTKNSLVRICGNFVESGAATSTVTLTFGTGTSTQTANFVDALGNPHTWKARVNATQPFTIAVSAHETACGTGCVGLVPNDPSDFQCRFKEYFSGDSQLPKPVPYVENGTKCVFYRVENPPPSSFIASDILYTVGYNEPGGPGTFYCGSVAAPGGVTRFFRDPSEPPPSDAADNHSFAFDFTTFFNPFGTPPDPTVGGDVTKNMSDFVVACRFAPPTGSATFLKPKAGTTYNAGSAIPFSLQVKANPPSGAFITDAATLPNAIPLTIFKVSTGVQTEVPTFGNPGGSPAYWTYSTLTNSYTANAKTPKGISPGSYLACVNSVRNLDGSTVPTPPPYFAQTCINFTIK